MSLLRFGSHPTAAKLKNKLLLNKTVSIIVLIFLVLAAGVFIYSNLSDKPQNPNKHPDHLTTAKEIEDNPVWKKNVDKALAKKDYEQYQLLLTSVANHYASLKDYQNAARLMNELFTNTPQDKILTTSYYSAISIADGQGDEAKKTTYTNKVIDLLKQQGRTEEANYVQKNLDKQ